MTSKRGKTGKRKAPPREEGWIFQLRMREQGGVLFGAFSYEAKDSLFCHLPEGAGGKGRLEVGQSPQGARGEISKHGL